MRTGLTALMLTAGLLSGPGGAPAVAQSVLREAIPARLEPADAEAQFVAAIRTVCIPAVEQGVRVAQLAPEARAGFVVARDARTRSEAGASAEETVWVSATAGPVVTVRERQGACVVQTYGPAAAAALARLAGEMGGADGFERLATVQGRTGLSQSLFRKLRDRRVQVMLDGSEPGMPGHRSQFSVLSATVFSTPE